MLNMRLAAPAHLVDINRLTELATVRVEDGAVRRGRARPARRGRARRGRARRAAAAAAGAAAGGAPGDPQPGHHRRQHRARRPERRDDRGARPDRRHRAGRQRAGTTRRSRPTPSSSARWSPTSVRGRARRLGRFPAFPAGTGTTFVEVARRHGDYAVCGLAAVVTLVDGVVDVGPGGVRLGRARRPLVLDLTEAVRGAAPGEADWAAAGDLAGEQADPEADIHATRRLPAAPGAGADRSGRSPRQRGGRWHEPRSVHDVRLTVNGVPRDAPGAGPPAAVRLPAPRPAADRHPRRLRARRLRCLHGAARRRAGALLPAARRDAPTATR